MPPYTSNQKHLIAEFVSCTRTKESVAVKVSNLHVLPAYSLLCGLLGYLEMLLSGHVGSKRTNFLI